jgi:hypothetical protein
MKAIIDMKKEDLNQMCREYKQELSTNKEVFVMDKESLLECVCREIFVMVQEVRREIQLTHSLNDAIIRCEQAAQKTLELSRQHNREVEFEVFGLRIEKGGNNED